MNLDIIDKYKMMVIIKHKDNLWINTQAMFLIM